MQVDNRNCGLRHKDSRIAEMVSTKKITCLFYAGFYHTKKENLRGQPALDYFTSLLNFRVMLPALKLTVRS